jgi:diguanylate cyclase (GGDEF)-like protein
MIARADQALAKLSRTAILATALVALAVIGVLDYLTGGEIVFSVFYVLPVGMATWYSDRTAGLVFASASSVVGYVAELAGGYPYHNPLIPIWNAGVRLSFFVIIAMLLSALRDRLAAEQRLARTDHLTGLLNSRAFAEQLEHDLRLSDRVGKPLTLAYVDLDDFKQVNDTIGHSGGDRVLCAVGRLLIDATRRADTVARLGGDEFALILPGTDVDGAQAVTSKLRTLLSELPAAGARGLTCSIGVVVFREQPATSGGAIAMADDLMYEAKTQGKNATVVRVHSRSNVDGSQSRLSEDAP